MKKLVSSLALLTCFAAQNQIQAWASTTNPALESSNETKAAPIDDRCGLFELDYLFWKPYQEDLNFALRATELTSSDGSTIIIKNRTKTPEFQLSSGVRLGFGGFTSDEWEVKVRGTYLYSDARKEAEATGTSTDVLFPSFFPFYEGQDGTEATAYWRLNFGVVDLTLGRETFLTPKFSIYPFIGVRSVWIRETIKGIFRGINIVPVGSPSATIFSEYKHTNDVWGIGPRVGMNSSYYFARNWSFQGGLSGAFVLGNFRAYQRLESQFIGTTLPLKVNLKDSHNMIRANLDAFIGIGWDKWFNNGKNRVYVALLCETSYWFGINQLMDLNITDIANVNKINVESQVASKRHGDLAFFGGTVHFQVDF